MNDWTLDILLERFDHFTEITTEKLRSITDEEYDELLLTTAELMFSEGRYSVYTEGSLEMYELQEAEDALCDLAQINQLDDDERLRLCFYKDLKAFCYPLFRQTPVDLTARPFCMNDGIFSIANRELADFLSNTPHRHLGLVICNSLVQTYWNDDLLLDTVVMNSLTNTFFYTCGNGKNVDDESYNQMIDDLVDVNNHLELGKRLGLSPTAQAVYDMTDTFVCKYYDYEQVDFAIAMGRWIENNWGKHVAHPSEEKIARLKEEFARLARKHHVAFCSEDSTLSYIFLDLLGCSLINEDEEDEMYDLRDNDFYDINLPEE